MGRRQNKGAERKGNRWRNGLAGSQGTSLSASVFTDPISESGSE